MFIFHIITARRLCEIILSLGSRSQTLVYHMSLLYIVAVNDLLFYQDSLGFSNKNRCIPFL